MLDKYMQQLTQEMEIKGSFATEVPGVYSVPVDDDLSVTVTEIPRGFSLNCTVVDTPTENQEEFYTQALIANLFGEGTEGCVLGLDSEGKVLTLSREIDYNIDYQEFRDILEDFLNGVEFWKDETKAYGIKLG